MRAGERLDAPYAKKGKSYTPYAGTLHWWFAGVAAGCEKERESARSRARGDEKAWSGGIGTTVLLQLSTIGGAINS